MEEKIERMAKKAVKEARDEVASEMDAEVPEAEWIDIYEVIRLAEILAATKDEWEYVTAEEGYMQHACAFMEPEELAVVMRAAEILAEFLRAERDD